MLAVQLVNRFLRRFKHLKSGGFLFTPFNQCTHRVLTNVSLWSFQEKSNFLGVQQARNGQHKNKKSGVLYSSVPLLLGFGYRPLLHARQRISSGRTTFPTCTAKYVCVSALAHKDQLTLTSEHLVRETSYAIEIFWGRPATTSLE